MASARDVVDELSQLHTAQSTRIAHSPTGVTPGYHPGLGATVMEDGRLAYVKTPAQTLEVLALGTLIADRTLPSSTPINILGGPGGGELSFYDVGITRGGGVTFDSGGDHFITARDEQHSDVLIAIFTSGLIAPATWAGQELWIQARRTGASDADSCMARIAPNGSGISAFWSTHWSRVLPDGTQIFPELEHSFGADLTLIAMEIMIMRARMF